MALFLEIRDLRGDELEALMRAQEGIRCLKHWPCENGRTVAILVEAEDEETLVAQRGGAKEISELFAPAERWTSYDSIEVA